MLLCKTRWFNYKSRIISLLFLTLLTASGALRANSALEVSFLDPEEAFQPQVLIEGQTLTVQWQIADGYYLYHHGFKGDVERNDTVSPLQFNVLKRGKKKFDDNFGKEVETFHHGVSMNADLGEFQEGTSANDFRVVVESQGCADEGLCFPPTRYGFVVSGGVATPEKSDDPLSQSSSSLAAELFSDSSNENANVSDSQFVSISALAMTALAAMLGGIILNLMPCVFPVLSLKALSLSDAHEDPSSLRLHGWAYTAGVTLAFVLAASVILIARSAGESLGWGFQLQHPIFVSLMIYLFFVMGLSLSGAFEFGGAFMGIGQGLTSGNSMKSSFFTGVLAALVASPCTAPFMATALGVALTQPAMYALLIFVALGFGMALPFLLLSYAPVLHRWLPKPGNWMVTFKQVLAFPMYLTVIWLLWVLSHQTNSDTVVMTLAGMLLIVMGLWLSEFSPEKPKFRILRGVSIAAMIIPAILITTLSGNVTPENTTEQATASEEHNYEAYSPERLDYYRAQGIPVFIDLTADWCITCKVNEKVAFTSHIKNQLNENKIAVLVGDWTNRNPEISMLLKEQNRSGIPLYLMYPKGTGNPEVLPQILTEGIIEGAISRAIN